MDRINQIRQIFHDNYKEYLRPISELAFDSANNAYPSTLKIRAYNFDDIAKDVYETSRYLMPCSSDALLITDKLIFIEFKNGKLDTQEKKRSLRLKFAESPYLILAKLLYIHKLRLTKEEFYALPKVGMVIYNSLKNPSEVFQDRYNSRFQLKEYKFLLYDKVYSYSFKEFDHIVEMKGIHKL